MGNFLYLATEGAEGGFGINPDILGSNVINLALVITFLVLYGGKAIGKIFEERRAKIQQEIQEAENLANQAQSKLTQAQQDLTKAQEKAKQIKADAEVTAQKMKAEILVQGDKDIERMKATAAGELDSERAKVIAELKQRIAVLALEKAETQLKESLNDDVQGKLISRAVAQLGG
jgi:F-type H+-transporting ATPase subunit b